MAMNYRAKTWWHLFSLVLLTGMIARTSKAFRNHRASPHQQPASLFLDEASLLMTSSQAWRSDSRWPGGWNLRTAGWYRCPREPARTGLLVLFMGKGDGKRKRKKKSSSDGETASAVPARVPVEPGPLRVTNHVNIPVRHQIRLAQLKKELTQQASPSFRAKRVERTRYRRAWDEEEIEQKAEERRLRGQNPNWDVILNRTASSPLLVVDGYNIIYKWPRLKKHMSKGDVQRARELLIDDLENLRSIKGWRIECVFDGTKRSTMGPLGQGPGGSSTNAKPTRMDQEARASVSKHGVRIVFTGVGIEADTYIEARCMQAKNVTQGEITGSFIVATDDAMIRLAGQNAGALCMSADRFVTELKAVKEAVEYRVEAAVAKVNGHAIRPESIRRTYFHRFGRNSVVIEDKRNRTKTKKDKDLVLVDINLDNLQVEEDEKGVPWWARVPNQTRGLA